MAPLHGAKLRTYMGATATIRVDREVRDQLARSAEAEGITLAALLRRYARERMIASERAARLADELNPAALEEQDLWDETVGDGID